MSSEFNLLLTYTKMDNPEGIARLVTRYPDGNFTGGFKDRYPMTKFPLEIACVNRYHTVLRALLNVSGVDPNAKTFSKKTPLCLVLEAKDLIGFVILINDPRTDLNIICKGLLAYYRPITQLMWHRPVFLRHLIASGKPVDTGLLREAETNPEFKEEYLALLNLYEADPEVARHEARLDLMPWRQGPETAADQGKKKGDFHSPEPNSHLSFFPFLSTRGHQCEQIHPLAHEPRRPSVCPGGHGLRRPPPGERRGGNPEMAGHGHEASHGAPDDGVLEGCRGGWHGLCPHQGL